MRVRTVRHETRVKRNASQDSCCWSFRGISVFSVFARRRVIVAESRSRGGYLVIVERKRWARAIRVERRVRLLGKGLHGLAQRARLQRENSGGGQNAQRLAFNVSTFQTAVEGDPGRFLAVTQTPGRPPAGGLKAPRVLARYATHYRQMHFIFINMTRDAPSRRGGVGARLSRRFAKEWRAPAGTTNADAHGSCLRRASVFRVIMT